MKGQPVQKLSRRGILGAIPAFAIASAFGGVARVLTACNAEDRSSLRRRGPTVAPTDDDEYVSQDVMLKPIDTGETPPSVPKPAWEARARQLEEEQARLYGPVFTADAAGNGVMAGKERSHVPHVELSVELGPLSVLVVVEHVMGGSGLPDAGSDASRDAGALVDAARDAAGDATADASVDASRAPEHYVSTVYLRAIVDGQDTVVGLWELTATDPAPAAVRFTLPRGVTSVVAYEWCTLHGLWKSDAVST